jgi:hypothetical protein
MVLMFKLTVAHLSIECRLGLFILASPALRCSYHLP